VINDYRNRANGLLLEHRTAVAAKEKETRELATIKMVLADTQEAQVIVQAIAQETQQRAQAQISSVVSQCLKTVFSDFAYDFEIRVDIKRGKTEATLVFLRDGIELTDPLNEVGGGVLDVASLALRLSCLLLTQPQRRKLLILDEPFSNIRGEENRARTRQLLQELAEQLDVQIIINTDIPEYRLGRVIEL
jgi:hypothetical protein